MTGKFLFFDLGTTLIDETKAYEHRIYDSIAGTDVTFEAFNRKRTEFAKQNLRGDIEAINFFGLKRTPWHHEDEVLYPDAFPLLEYLSDKGYRMGVIANQSLGTEERMVNLGIRQYFECILASAELGIAKPDRRIFELALDTADVSPENAVMIGDRLDNDIYPAMELGMGTVWVKQGFAVYQQLDTSRPVPDHITDGIPGLMKIF